MALNQSKIELILDLKNRIGMGLGSAKQQLRTEIGGMRSQIAQFSSSAKAGFKGFASEIPMVGKGLAALSNPIGGVVAGVGLLTAGLIKATNRASEFNSNFRELANLNLSKSQQEINDLRNLVLDTAWKKKFNADETAAAYNDIQSTIGLYGNDARQIVEKQGEFAKVMKSDMGGWVAGTSKAMANWRFGVDRLDDFNKSAYATMQVGVVSFEELSRVQSVYAGASASVKQDFDTANKLFALFTIKTKSVEQAGTLTKSLMNDLTKKTTVEAFRKIGINFYDMGGNLKQADKIMLELNKKFMTMKNDKAIVSLKNQFAGSEGLIAMIQAATDRSGELKKTFDEFTDSKLNFDNAVNMASTDIVYRQEQLANRIDNLVIRMGQMLLPVKEWIVDKADKAVSKLDYWYLKSNDDRVNMRVDSSSKDVRSANEALFADVDKISEAELHKRQGLLATASKEAYDRFQATTKQYADQPWYKYNPVDLIDGRKGKLRNMDEQTGYARHDDWARYKEFKALSAELGERWESRGKAPAPTGSNDSSNADSSGAVNNLNESLNRVVGSSQAPRNITVHIDAFNKGGINTQNTSLQKMDATQIEDWFTDMCMRAVRNVELSYY